MLVGDKLSEVKKRMREDDVDHRAHAAWKHSQRRAEKKKPETWTDVQNRNRITKREGHSEGMARTTPFWGGHDLPYAFFGSVIPHPFRRLTKLLESGFVDVLTKAMSSWRSRESVLRYVLL